MNEMTPPLDFLPWLTLAALGAYHGLNPGMGWLFAVALGLQERSRAAVVRAFAPIALGHALSVAAAVALVGVLQGMVAPTFLRWAGAGALAAFGLYKLLAPMSHPRWVGMRVGFRDLTVWSFLMATAHGAGLMLLPVLIKLPHGTTGLPPCHAAAQVAVATPPPAYVAAGVAPPGLSLLTEGAAVLLHTGAMFLVMAAVAVLVYEKLGLAVLRRAWFNLDLLWAIALIGAGILTLIL